MVSSPIIALYYTQLIGDAKTPPILLAAVSFEGMAVIGLSISYIGLGKRVNITFRCRPVHPWWKRSSVLCQPEQFASDGPSAAIVCASSPSLSFRSVRNFVIDLRRYVDYFSRFALML